MDRNALIRALRDTAQSASNAIASNISGPVDLIAAGLRGVGLPIPQNPVGGSQWMAERGLTAPVQQGVAQVIGDTIGLAGPALVANFAPQIASALNRGAQNLAAPRTLRPETGAIVWHGSPHKFDRFDSSKIGTGEGAQAYGHGLYFAESDRVAKQYADTLTDKAPRFLDGVPADQLSTAQRSALGLLAEAGGNPNAALLAAKTDMARAGGAGADFHVERYNTLRDIARGRMVAKVGEPSLYKVDLPDEQIARMLDWDKPLSQQAPEVQSVIRNIAPTAKPYDIPIDHDPTGAQFYGMLSAPTEVGQAGASQMFREMGIPGIRYLDGGSRGAGQGTSNFVVFPGNENILQILERNGQPLGLMGVR